MSAWEHYVIIPSRFLTECCKRQLNLCRFVLLYFASVFELYVYFPVQFLFASISQVIVAPKSASEMMLRSGLQVLSLLYVWKYVYHFEFPRSKTEADQVLLLNSTPSVTNRVKTALATLKNTHCLCVSYTLAARRHFYTLHLIVCTGYLVLSVDDDWSLSLSINFKLWRLFTESWCCPVL